MITFECHPAVKKVLEESQDISKLRDSGSDAYFVTTYLPSYTTSIHGGLEDAIWLRLSNPQIPLIILSFFDIEFIKKIDIYGILGLKGSYFMRLPIEIMSLKAVLTKCILPLNIPASTWKRFLKEVCKSKIREEISKMRHGGTMAIGNKILYPLRAACIVYPTNASAYAPIIAGQLAQLQAYLKSEEMIRLKFLLEKAQGFKEEYLTKISTSVKNLDHLADYASKNEYNVNDILEIIDNFTLVFNNLLDQ